MKSQQYRTEKLKKIIETEKADIQLRDWVTLNFEKFWELAKEAKDICREPFRIETPFGDWQFLNFKNDKKPYELP